MIPQGIFTSTLRRRGFATLSKSSPWQRHPAIPVIGLGLLGCAVIFAFAPADTFDNLDSQSFCERVVNGEATVSGNSLAQALHDCTEKGYAKGSIKNSSKDQSA